MLLSLALSTLGLQPGRLPLTRTVPLARVVSPQLQLAKLDVEGTNVEVICSAFNQHFPHSPHSFPRSHELSLLTRNGVDIVPHPLRTRALGALPDVDHLLDLPSQH